MERTILMNVVDFIIKIAQAPYEAVVKDPLVGRFMWGRNYGKGAAYMHGKLNPAFTPEALRDLDKHHPGMKKALKEGKGTVLLPSKKAITKARRGAISDASQGQMSNKMVKRIDRGLVRTGLSPSSAEEQSILRQHEGKHHRRRLKNPDARMWSLDPKKRGLRRVLSATKEEALAYGSGALKAPNVRKRVRALALGSLPSGTLHSVRAASGGSIRKEIGKGTLGRLAKKIIARGR